MPIDTSFFKPLNKSMLLLHYIPGLSFAKLVLYRAGFAVSSDEKCLKIQIAIPRLTIATPRLGESLTLRIFI